MVVVAIGCGRIGYDEGGVLEASPSIDAALPDVLAACPAGTTELSTGSPVCIELTERGTLPWTDAGLDCQAAGRRLCADAEWFEACVNAAGLVDMIDLGFEWVAEEAAGIALKRGGDACAVMSSHQVIDPYEYRCCVDR